MGEHRTSAYCEQCEEQRLCIKQSPNHILHLLWTILMLGLWLVVWIIITVRSQDNPFRCSVCGKKVQTPQDPMLQIHPPIEGGPT